MQHFEESSASCLCIGEVESGGGGDGRWMVADQQSKEPERGASSTESRAVEGSAEVELDGSDVGVGGLERLRPDCENGIGVAKDCGLELLSEVVVCIQSELDRDGSIFIHVGVVRAGGRFNLGDLGESFISVESDNKGGRMGGVGVGRSGEDTASGDELDGFEGNGKSFEGCVGADVDGDGSSVSNNASDAEVAVASRRS